MKPATPIISLATLATVFALGGCGGGGGGATGGGPSAPGPVSPGLPALAMQDPAMAGNAPVLYRGASLHVGADVAPGPAALSPADGHGDVTVSHGRVADGVGAAELIDYLAADARNNHHNLFPDGFLLRFGSTPPTVRVAAGTPDELLDETVRAVQLINAALPPTWQLEVSGTAPAGSRPPFGRGNPGGVRPPRGLVHLASRGTLHRLCAPVVGKRQHGRPAAAMGLPGRGRARMGRPQPRDRTGQDGGHRPRTPSHPGPASSRPPALSRTRS